MQKNFTIDHNEVLKLKNFAAALNSTVRQNILQKLSEKAMSVKELSFILNLPLSSISEHVKVLENADLIRCYYQAGKHGSIKLCAIKYEKVIVELFKPYDEVRFNRITENMPIGAFYDIDINPTCGIADDKGFIGKDDDVCSFYSANRFNAQILWFKSGYIEYRFPNHIRSKKITNLQFSLECCSEAPGYRLDFPSDITFAVNGVEICDWLSPGDFGGQRGAFTPEWWPINSTQYGLLKKLNVTDSGSFLDGTFVNHINLGKLNINENDYVSLRISVKETAKNVGGINIFGEKFGNYAQNIVMIMEYENNVNEKLPIKDGEE